MQRPRPMPRLNREESQARTRQLLIEAARGEDDLNRKDRRALGGLITKLFELLGKKVPGDPAELATGFIALGRGMALQPRDGEASRSGRIIVTFLKALIGSAPAAGRKA